MSTPYIRKDANNNGFLRKENNKFYLRYSSIATTPSSTPTNTPTPTPTNPNVYRDEIISVTNYSENTANWNTKADWSIT